MKRRPIFLLAPAALAGVALLFLALPSTDDPPEQGDGPGEADGPARPGASVPSSNGTRRDPVGGTERPAPSRPKLPEAAPGRISGVVRDEFGVGLGRAGVRVLGGPAGGEGAPVATGADGVFAIDGLPPGLHSVRAEAEGRVAVEISGVAAGTRDVDFVLVPGRRALVRVVGADDARPVEGARVEASTGEWSVVASWSGRNGAYELDGVPPGPVRIGVVAPDLVPAFVDQFVPADGPAEFQIEVETGRRASGRVYDARTEAGVEKADVEVWNEEFGPATCRNTRTGPGGSFEVGGLVPGPVGIRVLAKGYPPYDSARIGHSFLAGTTDDIVFEVPLTRGVAISGRVVGPGGAGVAGAAVAAREQAGDALARATSDASGRFSLSAVPIAPGLFLHASAKGLAPARTPALEWGEGESPPEAEIRLGEGVAIGGRVTNQDGAPVAAVRVVVDLTASWLGEVHPTGIEVETDAAGRYALGSLGPGTYPILFLHPDYQPHAYSLEIPEGARFRELPVDVVLPEGEALSGIVVDSAGQGVPAANVVAEQVVPGSLEGSLASAHTAFDGSFRLGSLAPGPVRLRVYAPGFLSGEAGPFRAGDESVKVELRRRFLLSGYVVAPELPGGDDDHPGGEGHAYGLGKFTVKLDPLEKSADLPAISEMFEAETSVRFVLDGVPEGGYSFEVIAAGYRPYRLETFLPAEWVGRDIVVRLDPGATLSGTVVAAKDDRPIAGAVVVRGEDLSTFDPVSPEAHQRVLGWTDSEGRFQVTGLESGGVVVAIYHDLYVPRVLRSPGAGEVVRLAEGGRVVGLLLDDLDVPAPGIEVVAEGPLTKTARTDDEGRFTFEGLAPGTYRLVRLDRPPAARGPTVEIAGSETVEVTFPGR